MLSVLVALLPWVAQPIVDIQEDDPRWNCATMGNRICGTPIPDVIVNVYDGCTYDSDGNLTDCEA